MSTARRARPKAPRWIILAAVLVAVTVIAAGFLTRPDDADAEEDRRIIETRLANPVSIAFSIERSIFSAGDEQIEAYRSAVTDVVDACVTVEDRSCRFVTYASDAGDMAGRSLPADPGFTSTHGAFFSLDTDVSDITLDGAAAIRKRRGRGYRDAVQTDLDTGTDDGCVDPFSGLRSALDALAGTTGERHVVVMGSGMWNCPPLPEVVTSEGVHLPHDQAISDALTMIEEGAAAGVTFHFVRFGQAFTGEWIVMTRDDVGYLEDVWTELVERWGGRTARAPREEMQFAFEEAP